MGGQCKRYPGSTTMRESPHARVIGEAAAGETYRDIAKKTSRVGVAHTRAHIVAPATHSTFYVARRRAKS